MQQGPRGVVPWCCLRMVVDVPGTRGSDDSERGSSLLGILSVVGILGILAVIALTLNFGSTPSTTGSRRCPVPPRRRRDHGASGTNSPRPSERPAKRTSPCSTRPSLTTERSMAPTHRPARGGPRATSAGGPFMQSWPSGAPAYSITWNGTTLSVVPAKGRASQGSVGTASPATGCFA